MLKFDNCCSLNPWDLYDNWIIQVSILKKYVLLPYLRFTYVDSWLQLKKKTLDVYLKKKYYWGMSYHTGFDYWWNTIVCENLSYWQITLR